MEAGGGGRTRELEAVDLLLRELGLLRVLEDDVGDAEARARAEICVPLLKAWGTDTGVEVASKCLLVLGLGKVGLGVARKGVALGMDVLGVDPFVDTNTAKECGVELVLIEEGLPRADFISLHTPLNDETRGLVGTEFLEQCKQGVRIINVSRGAVINDEALLVAVTSGKVAGAGLDVFEEEPPPADSPLRGHPAIVCTPHLGASTVEAQLNVGIASARQMLDYLRNGVVQNGVNEARSV